VRQSSRDHGVMSVSVRKARFVGVVAVAVAASSLVVAAASSGADATRQPEAGARWRLPPVNAGADYQLGGDYALPAGVHVVSRDRTGRLVAHAYNICYVNGFQTQDYQRGWWKKNHGSLLLRDHGKLVHDPGWPGEILLDTSTARKRAGIARVIG